MSNRTILIYETEAELGARTDERRRDAYWGAYRAYTKALPPLRRARVHGAHRRRPGAQAAALAEARGPAAGLARLDVVSPDAVTTYQPYWALRAHLLSRLGQPGPAAEAYARAIGLSEDPPVREFLARSLRR